MNGRTITTIGALLGVLAVLGACEGVKKQLGYTKQAPDEFRVVSRAPLTLPPDYALRPPEPGATRPQEGTATDQARRAVFRVDEPKGPTLEEQAAVAGLSRGEVSLLKLAGAEQADPKIRTTVDRETLQINEENQDLLETLVFWREPQLPGEVVDAEAEARRLRENAALGKSVSTGETPTIERRKKGFLEGIF
jgi:hypothetical protein